MLPAEAEMFAQAVLPVKRLRPWRGLLLGLQVLPGLQGETMRQTQV